MKTNLLYCIAGFILCTAFIIPTTHPVTSLCTDYRDAYTGSYFCKRSSTICNLEGAPSVKSDTISINVTKDALDSILQIAVGTNIHKFKLKNEILYAYTDGEHKGGRFFATDSIRLYISLGRAFDSECIGKKK